MKSRIFFKLLAAFALVIATTAVTLDLSVRKAWEQSLREEIERNLKQKTVMFANRVNTDHEHSIQEIASQEGQAAGARATVMDANGKILADSQGSAEAADDHAQMLEFDSALKGNVAAEARGSRSLGVPFLYVAAPISGGAVRLAYPLSDLEAITSHLLGVGVRP